MSKNKKQDKKKKVSDEPEVKTDFTKQMDQVANTSLVLQDKALSLKDAIASEYIRFEKLKINIKKEQDIMKKREVHLKDEIIELNVGGQTFTTFQSTLLKAKDSMLAAMFGGNFIPGIKDKNGRYFIDRPPGPFEHILDCLRTDNPLKIPEDELEEKMFLEEINYYGLKNHFKKQLGDDSDSGGGSFPKCTLLKPKEQKEIIKWIGGKQGKWKLLYRGTKDGFSASTFRNLCSNKGPTVTIVKSSNGYIFGGYANVAWSSSGSYQFDNKCFLFSAKNANGSKMIKLDNNGPHHSNQYSVYNGGNYGPTFGGGHDLYICDNCASTTSSYSNLGHSYASPSGLSYGTTQVQSFLAGSYSFQVSEIEVYGK